MQAEHRNPVQRDLKYDVDDGPDARPDRSTGIRSARGRVAGRPFLDQGKEALMLG